MSNPMTQQPDEILTDEELHSHLMEHLGLLKSDYASQYPGCELFCAKASESIFECLRRLNRLPRTDPFWTHTNRRPTLYKLDDYCRFVLENAPHDTLALWTMAALAVSKGVEGFGSEQWKALHALDYLDVTWPICAALLQGGPAGISDVALASLLRDIGAIETARPLLQQYVDSSVQNIGSWAVRVLDALHCDGRIEYARTFFKEGLCPGEWVARHGHQVGCWSLDESKYADTALEAWIAEVTTLLHAGAKTWQLLREQYLTQKEIREIEGAHLEEEVPASSPDNKSPEQLVHKLLLLSPNLSEMYDTPWVKEKFSQYRLCSDAELVQLYAALQAQRTRDLEQITEAHHEAAVKQAICPLCQSATLEKVDFYLMRYVSHAALILHHATVCTSCRRIFNIEDIAMFPA